MITEKRNEAKAFFYDLNTVASINRETVSTHNSVSSVMKKILTTDNYSKCVLLSAQTGGGKTHAILHTVVPYAKEHKKKVLFVSSRVAINTQFKRELIQVLGMEHLTKELTDEGLRVKEEFEHVTVITYPRLFHIQKNDPKRLKACEITIFDEVHSLLDDAPFNSITGYILKRIPIDLHFSLRIYLSATPDRLLPYLAQAETESRIDVLRFSRNYSYVHSLFFHSKEELAKKINADHSGNRWLVFMPTIAEGRFFRSQLNSRLSVLMLNGVERSKNPDMWNHVLKTQRFDADVCICTALIDAGVNFIDPKLKNIVVCSLNPNTIIQVLGRKRRNREREESVNLYCWCPDAKDIQSALITNQRNQDALDLYDSDYNRFLNRHVLEPDDIDARNWLLTGETDKLELNHLTKAYYEVEEKHLRYLEGRVNKKTGDCSYDRYICNLLHTKTPERIHAWLDPEYSGHAKAEFEAFLMDQVNTPMTDAEFEIFSKQFMKLGLTAFGKSSSADRDDRIWKHEKINKKLQEWGYSYRVVKNEGSNTLVAIKEGDEN